MATQTSPAHREVETEISPIPLMQLATAFWAFKTLAAANEIDLFTRIAEGGTTPAELARDLKIEERPAEMLLTACASLGLLEKRKARYVNSPLAENFLVRGCRYYFGGFVTMLDKRLYHGWDKLTEALRTNRPTTWDPDKQESLFDNTDPSMMATFWQAMHSLSTFTARTLGDAVNLSGFKRLLDVGGGSGAFDIELCRHYPQLRATVYDLPFVAEIALRNAKEAGVADRVSVSPGNFFTDAHFPAGHDVVLLSMIMHDWSEPENREILRKAFEALASGGAVVITELLVNDEKTGPPPAALMSLNMLIETRGGRNYTAAEYESWLQEIGFARIHTVMFEAAGANGAVVGYKP
jgi:3-hydroxy-5-methyl-1-naphthoate 3-O-methyltransferase